MVVIKCNIQLDGKDYAMLQLDLQAQAAKGVIVLPSWCELLNEVPADTAIQVVTAPSDCDTCSVASTCSKNHSRHGVVRINCPLWRP